MSAFYLKDVVHYEVKLKYTTPQILIGGRLNKRREKVPIRTQVLSYSISEAESPRQFCTFRTIVNEDYNCNPRGGAGFGTRQVIV